MISRLCKENVKEFLIAADMYRSARVKAASFDFLYKNRRVWSENILKVIPSVHACIMFNDDDATHTQNLS